MLKRYICLVSTLLSVVALAQVGTLDVTFGGSGIVNTSIWLTDDIGWSMATQSDGKIVIAGTTSSTFKSYFIIARFDTNGMLDKTLASRGIVTVGFGNGNDVGRALAIQPDGRIVVAGSALGGSWYDFAVARLN